MYISICITIYLIHLKNSTCAFSLKSSSLLYITPFYHRLRFFLVLLVSLRWHVLISLCDTVDARV